jgi:YidC/Oxa1 family membrane protein insertase
MQDKKNLLIVLLACTVVWLGIDLWLKPDPSKVNHSSQSAMTTTSRDSIANTENADFSKGIAAPPSRTMVSFENQKISGSVDLKGAIIRQCQLKDYKQTTEPNSPPVEILSQNGTGYGACLGWTKTAGQQTDLPDSETIWTVSHPKLTPDQGVTLSWTNQKGQSFFIDLSLDDQYLITVAQRVENNSNESVDPGTPLSALIRQEPVNTSGYKGYGKYGKNSRYMMLHEGAVGMVDGKLQEKTYKDLLKSGQGPWMPYSGSIQEGKQGGKGWLGITDKYWLAAIIPSNHADGRFVAEGASPNQSDVYKVEVRENSWLNGANAPALPTLEPGQSRTYGNWHLFLGPKKVSLLEDYEKKLNIDHFDMAVDFGWFYFITKPMFFLLSSLQQLVGNFVLAILIMTIAIKIVLFPLSARSFRSMSRMRLLQPQIQALKTRFADDKMRLNQAMVDLYKREKINPVSGCLPMLVQIPILFSLYKVLFISIEMRHASFLGVISDLSAPDPTSLLSGFGLFPWIVPAWMHIGIWPILMGVTMVVQQMMNSSSITDTQQKIMLTYVMPVIFTYMMASFPVGLVIYWTWSNFLTMVQQWFMMRYHQSV